MIQLAISEERYVVKDHSIPHRDKESFSPLDMALAVTNGKIIEDYPERKRCLFVGRITIKNVNLILHVVCDYTDENWIDLITAYIPDEEHWEKPNLIKRKKQ